MKTVGRPSKGPGTIKTKDSPLGTTPLMMASERIVGVKLVGRHSPGKKSPRHDISLPRKKVERLGWLDLDEDGRPRPVTIQMQVHRAELVLWRIQDVAVEKRGWHEAKLTPRKTRPSTVTPGESYYRYDITVPLEVVDVLGWKPGLDLEATISKDKLHVKPG